jgi:Flp pilus assembly protein TadG
MAAATRLRDATSVTAMLARFIIRRIRDAARRFVGANDGNIAVIFTIAAIPVIGFVGAAIDYSRTNSARASVQTALDSTALMLSKDLSSGTITASQVPTAAQSYFTALYSNPDGKLVTTAGAIGPVTATYTANNGQMGNTIQLSVTASVTTDFMKVLSSSLSTMNFTVGSTTAWGNAKMRVALALDNTGSMADNNKITALRNAVAGTGGLIDQLSALAQNPGDVYISVIPFAKVVNAGSTNYGATWIDWTDWLSPPTAQPANNVGGPPYLQASLPFNWHGVGPGMTCPFTNNSGGFTCTNGSANGSSSVSKIPSNGYICPSVDYNSHTLYNGCWDSELVNDTTPQVFCSGSSQCVCPSGAPTSGSNKCKCTGNGSNTSCVGPRYIHNWTQPAPTDTTDNLNQPHLSFQVGFNNQDTNAHIPTNANPNPNPAWIGVGSTPTLCATPSSLNCMTAVANNWNQPSTNPISTWTGCITDRAQSFDETGDAPATGNAATLFPANQYYENSTAYCTSAASTTLETVIPLSYNWSALKTAVNAMQPTGGTDQSVGLAWAWQSLLQTGPIPAPAEDPNTTYNRVIIILSDGLNTEDRWPNYGDGSTQNTTNGVGDIDTRQSQQCVNLRNAKDAAGKPMYTVYTIQVDTSSPPDPTSTLLQSCASSNGQADPSKFFMLTSSSQIATTFTTIGTALSQLRVAQ